MILARAVKGLDPGQDPTIWIAKIQPVQYQGLKETQA